MKLLPTLSFLSLILCATACSAPDAQSRGSDAPSESPTLTGSVLYGAEALGRPDELAIVGDKLIVVDALGTSPVLVLNASTGEVERTFGREGEGPGEFRAARNVALAANSDQSFWIYDIALKRLTELDLTRDWEADRANLRTVGFSASEIPMSPVWVDGEIVSPGIFERGRLGRFDSTGRFVGSSGSLPHGDSGDAPTRVLQHAYTGTLVARPGGDRLALGARHSDRLDLYRTDGTLIRTIRTDAPFEPAFQVESRAGQPHMASGEDMRFGFVDVYATGSHVYALFSGRRRKDYPGGRAPYGETVYVYDWEGDLQRVLRLDAEAFAIAADEEARVLYVARHDPDPAVLRYPLDPPS